jgi:hypothetical protein
MKAGFFFTTGLLSLTLGLAAPTNPPAKPLSRLPRLGRRQISPNCDLSTALDNISLPAANPALPAPGEDLFLAAVTIGRGTQNYTCGSDSTAAPVSTGAIAVLYDVSCIATEDPDLLAALPGQALAVTLPEDPEEDLMCGNQPLERSGHHFFNAQKTPTFDFTESGDEELGLALMSVGSRSAAPVTGAVPWLSLNRGAGSQGVIQSIYRMNTASGAAPATCAGKPAGEFTVEYAAQYWVFSSDA